MPRQLPWANKGGGSRTQVKQPARRVDVAREIDDDFFEGTILASGRKGKAGVSDSDDDFLQPLPGKSKSRLGEVSRSGRVPSSSPPPIAALEGPPQPEPMRTGISMFNLRDDEWMMVEDEFLETAKLFTRHMRIAEYDLMKEQMEEKKKLAEIARPVVSGAKLSTEGAIKEKSEVQEKRQRNALREVLTSQGADDDDGDDSQYMPSNTRTGGSARKQPGNQDDSDSEDLDVAKPPSRSTSGVLPPRLQLPASSRGPAAAIPVVKRTPTTSSSTISTFKKPPAPPTSNATKPRSRLSRATPFDMLDDYVPKKPSNPSTTPVRSSPPARPGLIGATVRSTPRLSPSPSPRQTEPRNPSGLSNETLERLAKRKAEQEKEDKDLKKKKFDKHDIPTFLF